MTGQDTASRVEESARPLGIVCGGGTLPFAVADVVLARGRPVFLLAIEGWADPEKVARYPHAWLILGRFGQFLKRAREVGCSDLICIGNFLRPSLASLRLDWRTLRLLPRLRQLFRGGDDYLLSGITRILEQEGFRILGVQDVAGEILMTQGALTARGLDRQDLADATVGMDLLDTLGRFDVGQAAVVADGRVLAIEAAEGTDAMLGRIGELRRNGRLHLERGRGVLVKVSKPLQERRMDLPTIGPATVEKIIEAGLGGIAVRSGDAIVAEPARLVQIADRAGTFVVGLSSPAIPCDS